MLASSFRALEVDLGFSPQKLSALLSLQGCAQAMSGPFWGCLADHGVPRRWLLSAGTFAWGILTFALAFVDSFVVLLILRLLNGVALGMLTPVAQSLIADIARPSERGQIFGWQNCVREAGTVISVLLTTQFASKQIYGIDGWRMVFSLVAALSIVLAAAIFGLMEEAPPTWR